MSPQATCVAYDKAHGGQQCGAPVTHRPPLGSYCEAHARKLAKLVHDPFSLVGMTTRLLFGFVALPKATVDELLTQWRIP